MESNDDQAATPALPLNYFEQHQGPWLPMVRAIAMLSVAFSAASLLIFIVWAGCYFWEQNGFKFAWRYIDGLPILLRVPSAIAEMMIIIGGLDALKLRENGRRWIVIGALILLITELPSEVIRAFTTYMSHRMWLFTEPYVTWIMADHVLVGIAGVIFPLFQFRFFRRAEVRALFVAPTFVPGENLE